MLRRALLVLCCWGLFGAKVAQAQPDDSSSEPSAEVAPGSPRAALESFLDLCRQGRYDEAASFLEVSEEQDGPQLARRLEAVFDRFLWGVEETLSAQPGGDTSDGLTSNTDRVGELRGKDGLPHALQLSRRNDREGRWFFPKRTVAQIDNWYSVVEDAWLRERLPLFLLGHGPRGLYWWQWLALPVLFGAALLLGVLLSALSRWGLRRVFPTALPRALTVGLRGPIIVSWALAGFWFFSPLLGGYPFTQKFVGQVVGAGAYAVLFWSLLRVVSVLGQRAVNSSLVQAPGGVSGLLPLGVRVARAALFGVAAIAILSALGFPVGSFLAGLGLGGLALALAFQKTGENLFGSLALGIDRPMQVGDLVRVEGEVLGYVESIGLRSTRLRTYDRTLVSIPNGKLAEMRIESLSARDMMRLSCVFGLAYTASESQVRAALEGMRAALEAHPKIWREDISVRLQSFGEYALQIEVMCWFETRVYNDFLRYREEALLSMMAAIEAAGARLAVPARALWLQPPCETAGGRAG